MYVGSLKTALTVNYADYEIIYIKSKRGDAAGAQLVNKSRKTLLHMEKESLPTEF